MHLFSAFPPHLSPRLSSLISHCSLQFTGQSNSGPCCNSSHRLPNAADFLAFPSPPNSINSNPSPSSSPTPAHSPAHHSAPQTSILSSSLHILILMLHELCSLYFFPLLALEGAAGLLPLPLPTSLPVRLTSACLSHKCFPIKVSGSGKVGAFCFPLYV